MASGDIFFGEVKAFVLVHGADGRISIMINLFDNRVQAISNLRRYHSAAINIIFHNIIFQPCSLFEC